MNFKSIRFVVVSGIALFLGSLSTATNALSQSETVTALFDAGRTSAAEELGRRQLADAERRGDQSAEWYALIQLAWFFDETGRHREAILMSNRALVLARDSNRSTVPGGLLDRLFNRTPRIDRNERIFREGRSLSWLGWAFSSIGRYPAAEAFYREAIRVSGPDSAPISLAAWGLSTQELGNLRFKQGHAPEGRAHVERALALARANGVKPGISECTAILSEIELFLGNISLSLRHAEEAVISSEGYTYSIFNAANAKYVLAKVALEIARTDPEKEQWARELIQQSARFAEDRKVPRVIAATKVLESKMYPPEDTLRRVPLLTTAYEILHRSESELRGIASAELGTALREDDERELARFYVEQGLAISDSILRQVDKAYILLELSQLNLADGLLEERLKRLSESVESARTNGDRKTAVTSSWTLAKELHGAGFLSSARRIALSALSDLDVLQSADIPAATNEELLRRRAELSEIIVDVEFRLRKGGQRI